MNLVTKFELISRYQKSAPVDVYRLASAFGITVQYQTMNNSISGFIEKIGDSYLIAINKDHPNTRQRFTLAHEIGHWMYHRELIDRMEDNKLVDTKMYRSDRNFASKIPYSFERAANIFAVDLIMPSDLIHRLIYEEGIENTLELAKILEVSKKALSYRLEDLEINLPQ